MILRGNGKNKGGKASSETDSKSQPLSIEINKNQLFVANEDGDYDPQVDELID